MAIVYGKLLVYQRVHTTPDDPDVKNTKHFTRKQCYFDLIQLFAATNIYIIDPTSVYRWSEDFDYIVTIGYSSFLYKCASCPLLNIERDEPLFTLLSAKSIQKLYHGF